MNLRIVIHVKLAADDAKAGAVDILRLMQTQTNKAGSSDSRRG